MNRTVKMLTIKKLTLILTAILLPIFAWAQDVAYDGQVIDKTTEQPIPNVSVVLLKEKVGTQTNEQGYFRLVSTQKVSQDTLVITSVGYKTFRLAATDHQPRIFITLEPSNTQLGQVNITDKKITEVTLGKFSWSDIKDIRNTTESYSTIAFFWNGRYAKLFEAPQNNALLTAVHLGRRDLEIPDADGYVLATTNKNTRFLMHILTVEPNTGDPGEVIFTKEVSLTDNSLFVTIDLSKDKLVLPSKIFFIAIDWLKIPYNEVVKLDQAPKAERIKKNGDQLLMDASLYKVYYQPFLVGYPKNSPARNHPVVVTGNMIWGNKDAAALIKAGPAASFVKMRDKWMPVYSNHECALSATIHY